uniref:Integrase catalytic domain-containing protein n=1 Tax=Wuchereria bancrofti TaxID=6293 RepID=A0AAF5Q0A4_WUCBA
MHVHGTLLNELDKLRQEPKVQAFLRPLNIEWKHTVPHAPWAGGLYERLISIFKSIFRVAVGKQLLDSSEMTTVAIEIEAIINSRPLTIIDDETMQPLRSMDFLSSQGYAVSPLPIRREHSRDYLLNYWKEGAIIADEFWEKWQTQYLQTLRDRKQREHKGPHADCLGAHRSSTQRMLASGAHHQHQSKQTVPSRGPEYRTRR